MRSSELYRRFARPVLAMAMRQLGDNGRAEDAAQETFAAVWRSAKSYRAERGSASAWLYAVARHAIIDRARQRREPVVEVPDEATVRGRPRRAGRGVVAHLARAPRARAAARARAGRARARLLERSLPDRDRELPRRAARDREDADSHRSRPPGRPARGGAGMSEHPGLPRARRRRPHARGGARARPGRQPAPLGPRAADTRFPAPSRTPCERIGTARPIWTRRRVVVAVALARRRRGALLRRRPLARPAASTPTRPCR